MATSRTSRGDGDASVVDGGSDDGGQEQQQQRERQRSHRVDVAKKETRVVNILRFAVLVVLLVTTVLVSGGVCMYAKNQQHVEFVTVFEDSATQVIETFHEALGNSIGALNTLSFGVTSVAIATNQTFPFVTVPDFELWGSNFRIESGAHYVAYMPIISNNTMRHQWEDYAERNRFRIDEEYERDRSYRLDQDNDLNNGRQLLDGGDDEKDEEEDVPFVYDDGSDYKPRIWSNGEIIPHGVVPYGAGGGGPYLPIWQRRQVAC